MKPTINLHAHTYRCTHATGTEREYVENAIKAGYKAFGFSDHCPMPFKGEYYSGFRMKLHETEGYVKTILDLREEYKKDIRVLLGFETEYYPALFADFLQLISPYPVDYLIMGQHFIGNEENQPYSGRYTDDESLYSAYIAQVIEGLQTGMFTYLAHPDLMCFTGPDDVYRKHTEKLLAAVKEMDIPLEINGLGIKGKRQYPSDKFFTMAAQYGCKIVFGLDAHEAERIGEQEVLDELDAMTKRCGITLTEDIVLRRPHIL